MTPRSTESLARALPDGVRELCATLRERGHEAWVVGGCVRDVLMGREASDWDVATTAWPKDVQKIFRRTIPTGLDHGTITVLLRGDKYEVTTLRGESGYADGRRPDVVTFGASIDEDLGRRDFTVNAIAYDPARDVIVDPWKGEDDLERRVIRAVRDPRERFAEDGLRVLRAARFVASLGFELDADTEAAIRPNLPTFAKVSPERVREEWMKAFRAQQPSRAFRVMRRTGMLAIHAPLIEGQDEACFERAMRRLDACPREPAARVASLVWEERSRTKEIDAWLRALKFSNHERESVLLVLAHADAPRRALDLASTRRLLRAVGTSDIGWVLATLAADVSVQGTDEARSTFDAFEARVSSVIDARDPIDLKALAITGADVMRVAERGPGRYVGEVLERLLDEVIEDPTRNDAASLLARAKVLAQSDTPKTGSSKVEP
ncbi:MAG: CCA tRNA nucleotidyltransferase [Deltaproteobacteria bacterium]|nr:CCA tRNA nucleotidyltransferase [Deltaproteobacteria bacterium]